ncbi:MAG TPA: peptidase U32 family protein [Spirochaetota bacterium]|nr:peptidase U32 family protein [Spirochaetota bacterium]HPN81940.1 peptidase U32 family protein [Spirochaetota bacterium]
MELVAPAGNAERMEMAFAWGADAVYAGADRYSLRARAENFSDRELQDSIARAHLLGKPFYLAVNAFFDDDLLTGLAEFLTGLGEPGPDALIMSDPGAMAVASRVRPDLPIHVSTQANTMNAETVRVLRDRFGIKRVVLARELTLDQISRICHALPDIEFEVFVHGAMCVAYSGRCIVSSYLTSRAFLAPGEKMPGAIDRIRSASLGDCSQTCRWSYGLVEEKREGVVLDIVEDDGKTMLLSSRDLCMVDHLGALRDAGVHALKIEGRMKSLQYAAVTSGIYRDALNHLGSGQEVTPERRGLWHDELDALSRREYSTGFYFLDNEAFVPSQCDRQPPWLMAGVVLGAVGQGVWRCQATNPVREDAVLSAFMPDLEKSRLIGFRLFGPDGDARSLVRPGEEFLLRTRARLGPMSILRLDSGR